jgi:hypothetical protein
MATFAVIIGLLFAALGVSAVAALIAVKVYEWITSRRERT